MKIDIETKFNIGDFIYYPIPTNLGWIPIKQPVKICAIDVQVTAGEVMCVTYTTLDDSIIDYAEGVCFATYEECKQWCNKENGEDWNL